MARIHHGGLAVRLRDIAEHAGRLQVRLIHIKGQNLEGGGIWQRNGVRLRDTGEPFHRRTIEANTFFKGRFQLGWAHDHGFKGAQNIRKPQADKADIAFLNGS